MSTMSFEYGLDNVLGLQDALKDLSLKEPFPLLIVPDLIFEGIVKYLSPVELLKLQATCKTMKAKCYRAQRLITYALPCLHYKATNKIILYNEPKTAGRSRRISKFSLLTFLETRFKLECGHIKLNVKNIGESDLKYLMGLFNKRDIQAEYLIIKGKCTASVSSMEKFVKKLKITGLNLNDPVPFVHNNISALKQVENFFTEEDAHYDEDFVLANNFAQMEIYSKAVIPLDVLHQVIKELINGKRVLSYWCLGNAIESEEDVRKLFYGYPIVSPSEAEQRQSERPFIIDRGASMGRFVDIYRYKVICKDGTVYKIGNVHFNLTMDLIICT